MTLHITLSDKKHVRRFENVSMFTTTKDGGLMIQTQNPDNPADIRMFQIEPDTYIQISGNDC